MKLANRVLKEVPELKNLEQLRKYTSSLGNETSGIAKQELWGIGKQLQGALREAEDSVLTKTVADKAPQLLEEHALTRTAYKDLRNTVSDLNARLHVGSHAGPKTFINALTDMDGEAVIRRLSPKGKTALIDELSKSFPTVAKDVQNFHLDQLIKNSSKNGELSPKVLLKNLDKLAPEMRNFIVPPGAAEKLQALQQLIESVPARMNPSGTAKTLDALWSKVPESATAAATMIAHGNPAAGWLIGHVGKLLARDVPDAAKLALLKFMGSGKEIDAGGFKAMADFIHSTMRGESLIGSGVKNVFRAGADVLPSHMLPKESDRTKLDKALKSLQKDPDNLMKVGGKTAHYLPEQGQAIGQTAANAANYLNAQRPATEPKNPLDAKRTPSFVETAKYNRTLDLAQQPLTILDHIKKGTLAPSDVVTVKTLYPALYNKLATKLTEQVFDQVEKGKIIPYNTRMALSVFLAKPLDSTMTPQAIMSAQPQDSQGGDQQQASPVKHSTTALSKLPSTYQTANQAREAQKLKP